MADPILDVQGLTVDFPTDDGVVRAVRGVDFKLGAGEVLGIVGESGSGKSVTSLAIMGLLPRTAKIRGSARFKDRDLLKLSEREMTGIRGRHISMIFQDPIRLAEPRMPVNDIVAEPLVIHDLFGKHGEERVRELLMLVGSTPSIATATRTSSPEAHPRPPAGAQAHRAGGRRAEPGEPAVGLPLPHPLLEGAGDLRQGGAPAGRPRPGPPGRLPLRGAARLL